MPDVCQGTRDSPFVRALAARSRRGRHEPLGRFAAEPLIQLGAEELGLPVVRERPREVREGGGVRQRVVRDIGGEVEQRVFDRKRRRGVDPRPESRTEPAVDVPILVGPSQEVAGGRPVQSDRPDEPVVFERVLAEDLRQTAGRGAQRELDLEEPFSRRSRPPCANHRSSRVSASIRGTPKRVATDRDGTFQAAELERALLGEE
jgi:hypothetical protein